eukprot:4062933-Prymnesium_polylepis.2
MSGGAGKDANRKGVSLRSARRQKSRNRGNGSGAAGGGGAAWRAHMERAPLASPTAQTHAPRWQKVARWMAV